jgi:antitoxin (DNA-binding transcriptional repressor) of toxin-antitoxin stability system
MKVVRISEAKKELAHHLEYVKRGGTIRIVDHERPVADLVPIRTENDGDDDDALLARLEQRGLVRRGSGGPVPADLLRPGPAARGAGVLNALVEDRRSSR